MSPIVKDPAATLDYSADWNAWLDGDTILTSTWEAPTGITVESSPAPSHAGGVTTVWLSGGTAGERYAVVNHVVTAAGRIDERTLYVHVMER